jgi:hypothetical protein
MTLDAEDKMALSGVRFLYGSPKVADLIESMDAQYGTLPAMKQVNQKFTELAKAEPAKLKALNAVLERNPDLANKIQATLGKDPEVFRTTFLPAVFKNPEAALTLVDQQPKSTQAGPVAAPKPAPITRTYGDPAEPVIATTAAIAGVSKLAEAGQPKASTTPSTATNSPATTKAPDTTPEARVAAKMERLSKVPGYSTLMDNLLRNPKLVDAKKAMDTMLAGNGSLQSKERALDAALDATKEDPDLFHKLNKKLTDNPGALSTFGGMIASDPKEAMSDIVDFANDGPKSTMAGMFGKFMKNGQLDFGGILQSFASNPGGFIKMIFSMIIGAVGGGFAKSGMHNVLGSNVGMTGYDEAVRATDAKPSAVYGPEGQPVVAQAANTTVQDKTKPANTPQQPAQG